MIREECGLASQQHIIKHRPNIIAHIWPHCDKTRITVLFKPDAHLYLHHDDPTTGETDMPTAFQKWNLPFINTSRDI